MLHLCVASIQFIFALHLAAHTSQQFVALPVAIDGRVMELVIPVQSLLLPPFQIDSWRLHRNDGNDLRMTTRPEAQLGQSLLLINVCVLGCAQHTQLLYLASRTPHGHWIKGILAVELAIFVASHQIYDLEQSNARDAVIARENCAIRSNY